MHVATVLLSLFAQVSAAGAAAPCPATPLNNIVKGRYTSNLLETPGLSVEALDPMWHDDGSVVFRSSGGGFVTKSGRLGMILMWIPKVAGDLAIETRRLDGTDGSAEVRDSRDDRTHITTIVFPAPGCWQISSRLGDVGLTFVMNVIKPDDGPKALEGRVVDEEGHPIPDVDVSSKSGEKTDANGEFAVERADVIQFNADGYAPVVMAASELDANQVVQMGKTPDWVWKAPRCAEGTDSRPSIDGMSMHFTLPPDAHVEPVVDIDYHQAVICLASAPSECMVLSAGPLWSSGMMTDGHFIAGLTTKQRALYLPLYDLTYGTDIIGVRSDGTLSRWTGTINEDIKYENVSKKAADFFDQIIDSLCWR